MATYLIKQGCEDEDEDIIDDVTACVDDPEGQAGTKRTKTAATGLSGCGRGTKSKDSGYKKPLTEDDLRQLLTRQVEEAQRKEREERLKGLADGRLAYLQKTHYSSAWRETGIIPPRGQRGDEGDFHRGQNIGSRTSIAGLNHYVPPIVDLPMRAVAYLEEHKIIYLLEEILTEMLVRRPTSPRRYLLNWLKNVRGPIEKPTMESTPSTGTLCSSCLDEKKSTEKMRIELCDCQESYEDLRTEAEKRKDIPLTPKLVDPQQWLWEEEDKVEKEREREGEEESNDGSEMEGKSQEGETDEVEEAAASGATVSEPGSGGGEKEEEQSSEKSAETEAPNVEAGTDDAERTEQSEDNPDDGEKADNGGETAEDGGSEENTDKSEEDGGAAESGENQQEEAETNVGSASGTSEQPIETEQAPAENVDENFGEAASEVEAAVAEDGSDAQEEAGTEGTDAAAQETEQPTEDAASAE